MCVDVTERKHAEEKFTRAHRHGFSGNPRQRAMGVGRELFAMRRDGTEVAVEIGLSPIETEDGSFLLAAVTDITERRKAEEALRTRQAELDLITSHTPLLLTRCRRDLRYVFVNRACTAFFGRPVDEIIGWIATVTDITERKRAENELKRTAALLEAANVAERALPAVMPLNDPDGLGLELLVHRSVAATATEAEFGAVTKMSNSASDEDHSCGARHERELFDLTTNDSPHRLGIGRQ